MKHVLIATALTMLSPMAHADFCSTVHSFAEAVENEDTAYLPTEMTLEGSTCEYGEGYDPGSVMDASCLWFDDAKTAAASTMLVKISEKVQACDVLSFKSRTDDGKTIRYNYVYGDWVIVTLLKSGPGGVSLRFQPYYYY